MKTETITLSAMNCHHRFYPLEEFFQSAKRNGYHEVELWSGPQHFFMDDLRHEAIAKLIDLEQRYDIKIIGICPEQTNPKPNNMAARDPEMQERVFHYFCQAIDVASLIKARQVVVTSGWAFLDEPKEEARQRSIRMLKRISAYAKQKGMLLAIEALQKEESVLANTAMELKALIDAVASDSLKVCLDFGAMARAQDTIQDYFDCFGSDILHCHFVDVDSDTTHLAWGDGSRDMLRDLRTLYKVGYAGSLSVECVNARYFQKPYEADRQSMRQFIQTKKELAI